MKRRLVMVTAAIAIILSLLGYAIAQDESKELAAENTAVSTIDLLERIEKLERRIAELEKKETVRWRSEAMAHYQRSVQQQEKNRLFRLLNTN